VHAVFAGFIGGGADHAASGRVAITADDHWAPAELGTAQQLDSRDELVQVDVQHPVGHIASLPSRLRFMPSACIED
jgi:hypothetical protein